MASQQDYPIKLFEDNKVLFTNLSPVVPVQVRLEVLPRCIYLLFIYLLNVYHI